jgi:hypothetical protein
MVGRIGEGGRRAGATGLAATLGADTTGAWSIRVGRAA